MVHVTHWPLSSWLIWPVTHQWGDWFSRDSPDYERFPDKIHGCSGVRTLKYPDFCLNSVPSPDPHAPRCSGNESRFSAGVGSCDVSQSFYYASVNNSMRRASCFQAVRPSVRCPSTPVPRDAISLYLSWVMSDFIFISMKLGTNFTRVGITVNIFKVRGQSSGLQRDQMHFCCGAIHLDQGRIIHCAGWTMGGGPRRHGAPPISCQIFTTLFWRLNVQCTFKRGRLKKVVNFLGKKCTATDKKILASRTKKGPPLTLVGAPEWLIRPWFRRCMASSSRITCFVGLFVRRLCNVVTSCLVNLLNHGPTGNDPILAQGFAVTFYWWPAFYRVTR